MHRASVNVSFKRHLPPEPLVQIQNKFTCADPGFFSGGGEWGGGAGPTARKQSVQRFLPIFFQSSTDFTVYREGPKLYFSKDPDWSNSFQGDLLFPGGGGGGQILISLETHIICNFPGGSGPPIPPSGSAHDSHECSS